MRRRHENSTQGKKKIGTKLVVLPKLCLLWICHYLWLAWTAFNKSSFCYYKVSQLFSTHRYPVSLNGTQFHPLYSYTQFGGLHRSKHSYIYFWKPCFFNVKHNNHISSLKKKKNWQKNITPIDSSFNFETWNLPWKLI